MHAALGSVDVVRERNQDIGIHIGILHGDFRHRIFPAALNVNHIGMERCFVDVQVFDKGADTALITHGFGGFLSFPRVGQGNAHTRVQKRLLTQALVQHLIIIFGGFKDFRVSHKADGRTSLALKGDGGNRLDRFAAFKAHGVLLPAVAYLGFQPDRKRVHDRGTDAVQAAGNLIAVAAELAARMQHG